MGVFSGEIILIIYAVTVLKILFQTLTLPMQRKMSAIPAIYSLKFQIWEWKNCQYIF